MDKHFALIVEYASGECVYLTDTDDLIQALEEFKLEVKSSFEDSVMADKTFYLPQIISAKIVKLYYKR